jgi:hypothetical protein
MRLFGQRGTCNLSFLAFCLAVKQLFTIFAANFNKDKELNEATTRPFLHDSAPHSSLRCWALGMAHDAQRQRRGDGTHRALRLGAG